jgi:lysophospholipase L1-like esterase
LKRVTMLTSIGANVVLISLVLILVLQNGGIGFIKESMNSITSAESKEEYEPYYYNRNSIFKENSENITNDSYIFVGDSLTDSNEWSESFPNAKVLNRGVINDTTNGVLDRLENIVINKPKVIFIMIGTNDLGAGKDAKTTFNSYEKILAKIKEVSPNTQVVIQSLIPVEEELIGAKRNSEITLLNDQLREYAAKNHIEYVNLYSLFENNGQLDKRYTNDGVHINANGYELWEGEITKYIE